MSSIKTKLAHLRGAKLKPFFVGLTMLLLFAANAQQDSIRNICKFLGGRADKNFLGSGNMALVVQEDKARVLFVQQWKENGLFDWAAGTVASWSPDHMEMKETSPSMGATLSHTPLSRKVFITRDDVLGMELTWNNPTTQELTVNAAFTGILPGNTTVNTGYITATAPYSDKVQEPLYYIVSISASSPQIDIEKGSYTISQTLTINPGEQKSLSILLGIGTNEQKILQVMTRWKNVPNVVRAVQEDWNSWFRNEIPSFTCSNPYFDKLYYYRWWSLYTKMIFAQVGHFYYPSPREGTVAYDGVVSYSGSCISVDELRWMRNPEWAFSTTKEFFAPQNLNDGYLSNHIWDWGIDNDVSNMDTSGRSLPYQNYAIDAFRGALLVHPEEGKQTLKEVWPQMLSNLESYGRLFDSDKDGLYETYPWSNTAGQEWTVRFAYFDPIPELFRNERGRTYAPDGSNSEADMVLAKKIKAAVVTDPQLQWPETPEELYNVYYDNLDHRLATVDQTTYAYRNFKAASSLAKLQNNTSEQVLFRELSKQAKEQLLSVMWDANDRYFYDVKPFTKQKARVKASTGFYVFWAGIASKDHVPMLQHLFNPDTFWTEYPVPSLPLDYETYNELQEAGWNYWNYYTWPRTTCHVVDGALWAAKTLDTSLTKNASMLFEKYTQMHFPKGDIQIPNIAERYDPHTGFPFMENLDYNHSSWIDILMKHVAGITPQDSRELIIDPVDMGWKSFSIKNIRYQNHDINVVYSKNKGMTVTVDGVVKAKTASLQKVIIEL